jgi:lipoprotein-anchoring transpeptidase ErfK/SrfK
MRRILVTLGVSVIAAVAMESAAPSGALARTLPAPDSGPPAACGKVIDVDLTTQQLVASSCGDRFLSTPITSGRPGLRTPTGSYTVYLKEQNVYFFSPWPQGDPNYYPPMFIAYAMEFLDGGYFLHTDPAEPAAAFGPGSENGPYAAHGCVHVPIPVMVKLYAWTDSGTAVLIHY